MQSRSITTGVLYTLGIIKPRDMGYISLTNDSPDARVHIRGASNRTVGQLIDVTKPLTGTFDILANVA